MRRICPICKREFKDILKHMSIFHEIDSIEKYEEVADKCREKDKKCESWIRLNNELEYKLKNKKITIEQFREAREKWIDENE